MIQQTMSQLKLEAQVSKREDLLVSTSHSLHEPSKLAEET